MSSWKAALIDAPTQAGKTWKCFEVLTQKLKENANDKNVLVLFVTQANCITSASQVIQRASKVLPVDHICRSAKQMPEVSGGGHYMVVDFWNSRNINNMIRYLQGAACGWHQVVIVIDECEQGGLTGVKTRLDFVVNIEKICSRWKGCEVSVMMITATVANLSKTILKIAKDNPIKFSRGVVGDLLHKSVVANFFAKPHETYVPASWYKDAKDNTGNPVWRKLMFIKKESDMTTGEYMKIKENHILQTIGGLSHTAKELCLIVTSTRVQDHSDMADKLYRIGFNVCVELNGTNNKNFRVNYVDEGGNIRMWNIPYNIIENKADKGDLKTFYNHTKKLTASGILQKEDLSLSHMLQAALFMGTNADERIRENITMDEYNKLDAIFGAMCHLDGSLRRPDDYPVIPRVALIAGHLAGRGISIQNPFIDFTCTSFCFTDTRDIVQRGASNTQRFGRACGMLRDVFARKDRAPVLIATEAILQDAIANEKTLMDKISTISEGERISLKDLVSKMDWDKVMKDVKRSFKVKVKIINKKKEVNQEDTENEIDGVNPNNLMQYFKSPNLLVGKMIRYLYKQDEKITFEEFKCGIAYDKSDQQFLSNIKNGMSINSCYGKIWNFEGSCIDINAKIRQYIDKQKLQL